MKKLCIIGAGGHSNAIRPYIDQEEYEVVGYLDDFKCGTYHEVEIIGRFNEVFKLINNEEVNALFIAIGDCERRNYYYDKLEEYQKYLINIIAPSATIIPKINNIKGTFIGHNAFIGAEVELDDNCIVNTNSVIEHNSVIKKHSNIAPTSVILGNVDIGEGTLIGASSTINPGLHIAPRTVVGSGSILTKNTVEGGVYVGHPAVRLR